MIKEDACPKCGSEDQIDWGTFEYDGQDGRFDVTCGKCGFEGRQWLKIAFDMWQEARKNDSGKYEDIEPYEKEGCS